MSFCCRECRNRNKHVCDCHLGHQSLDNVFDAPFDWLENHCKLVVAPSGASPEWADKPPYKFRTECAGYAVELTFGTHAELAAWMRANEPGLWKEEVIAEWVEPEPVAVESTGGLRDICCTDFDCPACGHWHGGATVTLRFNVGLVPADHPEYEARCPTTGRRMWFRRNDFHDDRFVLLSIVEADGDAKLPAAPAPLGSWFVLNQSGFFCRDRGDEADQPNIRE